MGVEQTTQTTEVVEPNASTGEVVTPTPVSLKDDDLVEIVWKGEKIQKPWKEARSNIQFQEDYTRSKQELAKQAKELNDLYQGLKSREQAAAEKEAALDAILGRTKPADKKQAEIADDEVITGSQVKELLAKQREELNSTLESKLTEHSTRTSQERMFQRWEDLTNETVASLTKENPILNRVPQLSLVLKREALTDKPQTEEEMKQAIVKAGQRLAKGLDEEYTERRKAEVTRKNELKEKGPTLASGAPQLQQPKKSYGERGKIKWDELERDAIAAVEALEE